MTPAKLNLRERLKRQNPEFDALYAAEKARFELGDQLRALREAANLSQAELARRVGTTPSVISRLESANYGGHSMPMLRRVAAALGQRVEVRFVSEEAEAA